MCLSGLLSYFRLPLGPGRTGPLGPGRTGPLGPGRTGPFGPGRTGPLGNLLRGLAGPLLNRGWPSSNLGTPFTILIGFMFRGPLFSLSGPWFKF